MLRKWVKNIARVMKQYYHCQSLLLNFCNWSVVNPLTTECLPGLFCICDTEYNVLKRERVTLMLTLRVSLVLNLTNFGHEVQ